MVTATKIVSASRGLVWLACGALLLPAGSALAAKGAHVQTRVQRVINKRLRGLKRLRAKDPVKTLVQLKGLRKDLAKIGRELVRKPRRTRQQNETRKMLGDTIKALDAAGRGAGSAEEMSAQGLADYHRALDGVRRDVNLGQSGPFAKEVLYERQVDQSLEAIRKRLVVPAAALRLGTFDRWLAKKDLAGDYKKATDFEATWVDATQRLNQYDRQSYLKSVEAKYKHDQARERGARPRELQALHEAVLAAGRMPPAARRLQAKIDKLGPQRDIMQLRTSIDLLWKNLNSSATHGALRAFDQLLEGK